MLRTTHACTSVLVRQHCALQAVLRKAGSQRPVLCCGVAPGWLAGLLRSKPRVAVSESLLLLKDEYLYLKLFKDVLRCDVDMLLPGTVVKFMWYDWVSPNAPWCGNAVVQPSSCTAACTAACTPAC